MLRFTSSSDNSLVPATNRQLGGHVKLSDSAAITLANALKTGDPRVQGLVEQLDRFQKNTVKGHGRDSTHQLVEQLGDNTAQMRASAVTGRLKKVLEAQQTLQMQGVPLEIITKAKALAVKVDAKRLSMEDYIKEMEKLGISFHPNEESPATEAVEDQGKGNEDADAEKVAGTKPPKTAAQKAAAKRKREKYKANLKARKAAEQAKQVNAGDSKPNPFASGKEALSAEESS